MAFGKGKAKKAKNPFEALNEEWRNKVGAMNADELKTVMSEVAKAEEKNKAEKKADPDVNDLRRKLKTATSGYSAKSKEHKLQTKYIVQQMSFQGDTVAEQIMQLNRDAEDDKLLNS